MSGCFGRKKPFSVFMSKRDKSKKIPVQSDDGRREALYGRVSTDDQSLASQLPDLDAYAAKLKQPPLRSRITTRARQWPGRALLTF